MSLACREAYQPRSEETSVKDCLPNLSTIDLLFPTNGVIVRINDMRQQLWISYDEKYAPCLLRPSVDFDCINFKIVALIESDLTSVFG